MWNATYELDAPLAECELLLCGRLCVSEVTPDLCYARLLLGVRL